MDKIWSDKIEDVSSPRSLVHVLIFWPMNHAGLGAKKCHFRVQVLPCLRALFFYYPSTNSSWMARKYFLWTWFAVLAWFWPFVSKKCQNMEKKSSYQTENPYLDSPHTKNPMFTNFFLLSENKVLAPEQHCTHIVLVMWPESIELVFLGFILMV